MARSLADILDRACDYPYSFPTKSYLFNAAKPKASMGFDKLITQGRTPVIAFGSNQSPVRLHQKFGHDERNIIPVERATLYDFDVVYSAHITSYGALPAMLQYSLGAHVNVAITWLDATQLEMMHQTEIHAANYHFSALENIKLEHEDGASRDLAYAYIGTRGQLTKEGVGISLSAIKCHGRQGLSMTTKEALNFIHQQLATTLPFDDFIVRLVEDIQFRQRVTEHLSQSALSNDYEYRIIK